MASEIAEIAEISMTNVVDTVAADDVVNVIHPSAVSQTQIVESKKRLNPVCQKLARTFLDQLQELLSDNTTQNTHDKNSKNGKNSKGCDDGDDDEISFQKYFDDRIKELYRKVIAEHNPGISLGFLSYCYRPPHLINHYFDQIYVLNLDNRPDRMDHMRQQLHKHGIYHYQRFSALNGKEEPHFGEWKAYSKTPLTRQEKYKYHRKGIGSPGSWAILKSMWKMIKDAQEQGYQRILVLQDDLLFHKHFNQRFDQMSRYIPKRWKLLYLGATQHSWNHVKFSRCQRYYHPVGTADGAFAVAIDRSIFQEMMEEMMRFRLPVDSGALKVMQRRYPSESVVLAPNLMIADIRDSDLRSPRDIRLFSERFRWDLSQYMIVDNVVRTTSFKLPPRMQARLNKNRAVPKTMIRPEDRHVRATDRNARATDRHARATDRTNIKPRTKDGEEDDTNNNNKTTGKRVLRTRIQRKRK